MHVLSGWTGVLPLGEADHMCIKAKRPSLLHHFQTTPDIFMETRRLGDPIRRNGGLTGMKERNDGIHGIF